VQKNHFSNRSRDPSGLEHFAETGSKMTLTKLRSKLQQLRVSFGRTG